MAKNSKFHFVMKEMPEIEENGTSFEENSLIKARTISKLYNQKTLSDDSGLCVESLDGRPGVYTARYKENLKNQEDKLLALIDEVNEKNSSRKAKFVCVLTLYLENGNYHQFRGESYGEITKDLRGTNGHGYDPIFYSTELGKTFAEATIEEKDAVSHRGRAFKKLEEFLNGQI